MSGAHRGSTGADGFTLIEIVAAVAILAAGLMILVESHYNAMSLFAVVRDETDMQHFLAEAVAMTETRVLTGSLDGSGDFGRRHKDFAWSYTAARPDDAIPMYAVEVTVTGPPGSASAEFRTFAVQKE